MRRDIQVDTTIGEIVFRDMSVIEKREFEWDYEADTCVYGIVTVPYIYDLRKLYTEGVSVDIAYHPVCKPIKLSFCVDYGEGYYRFVINPRDNTTFFDVVTRLYGGEETSPNASELVMVNSDGHYLFLLEDGGKASVWSPVNSDISNRPANIQNRNMLLQCVPSNNYRYPTTGVGAVRYLHSNLSASGFAHKLKSEFSADGVTVVNAAFDTETGDLDLDLDFSKANEDV